MPVFDNVYFKACEKVPVIGFPGNVFPLVFVLCRGLHGVVDGIDVNVFLVFVHFEGEPGDDDGDDDVDGVMPPLQEE